MSACPPLPTVWRPGFARWTAYGVAAAAALVLLGVALILPVPWSDPVFTADRLVLAVVGLVIAGFLARFGRMRVEADDTGLRVVNAFSSRRLAWAQVLAVRLAPGDSWVQLDLADATTCAVMAIQSADGERGRRMARELASCVEARSGLA